MNTILITAGHGQGKTTTLLNLANSLILQEKSVTGVVERAFIINGHRLAYFFESLPEHKFFMAARRRNFEKRADAFEFFPDAFEQAKDLILRPADWCFADEIGLIEAEGNGLWPAITGVFQHQTAKNLVMGIRGDQLELFARRIANSG